MSVSIGIDNAVKKYEDMTIIPDLSAFIKNGEFFTLPGPSGCGETTLLRMIAGFNSIEGGGIKFDGKVVDDILAQKRNIGMVLQSYAIFPHLTVRQNVEYGLKIRKVPKKHMKERVDEVLKVVKIDEYQNRLPERLSGGQQQRVALARAIVIHPQVLLMDEPLSNLDAKLRIETRSAIRDVQKQVGIITVYVTHDQEEVLAISDRVAVMKLGVTQQIGNPRDIYVRPCNVFASTFIGHFNLSFGTIRRQGGVPSVVFKGGYYVEMPDPMDTVTEGQRAVASVRPKEFSLNQESMDCEIISRTFLGKYTNYFLRSGEGTVLEDQSSIEYSQDLDHVDRIFAVGEEIRLRPNLSKINVSTQGMEQSLIKDVKRYDE